DASLAGQERNIVCGQVLLRDATQHRRKLGHNPVKLRKPLGFTDREIHDLEFGGVENDWRGCENCGSGGIQNADEQVSSILLSRLKVVISVKDRIFAIVVGLCFLDELL